MARLTPSGETTPTENPVEPAESTAEPDPEAAARKARKKATGRATGKATERATEKTSEKATPDTTGRDWAAPAGKVTAKAASKTAPKSSTKGPSKASPNPAPNPAPKATTGTTGTGSTEPAGLGAGKSSTDARSAAAEVASGTRAEETAPEDVNADARGSGAAAAAAATGGENAVEGVETAAAESQPPGETSTQTSRAAASATETGDTPDNAVEAEAVGPDGTAGDGLVAADTLTGVDHARRAAVVAAEIFCVVGTLVGVGVLGTRVEESSGGALAADATLIAPAGPAFSIWTPIYLGLLGYTIWQATPSNATRERTRATGWLAAASMVLNAVWLLVTQQGWIWVSVAVIALLAAVLGTLVSRLTRERASSTWERVLVDITFGAYLGWVAVATAANVTAALVESGVDLGSTLNQAAAVLVVAIAALVGVFLASRLGGRWAVAGAMAWGLGWIAVGRFTDEPRSVVTGVAAAAAAAVVLAATARFRANGVVYHGRHS